MCTRAYVLRIVLGLASITTLRLDCGTHAQALADAPSTLCIEPAVLDFGEIPSGTIARRTVKLINVGAMPLTILSHRASCGCTQANLPPNTTLEAGESREITIPLSAGSRLGPMTGPAIYFRVKDQSEVKLLLKAVAIAADDQRENPAALGSRAADADKYIVKIDPGIVDFGEIATGETAERTVRLINTGEVPKTIVSYRGKMALDIPPNLVIAPNESRVIKVTLNGGANAAEIRGKKYWFAVEGQPDVEIPLKATAVSFVTHEPEVVTPEANPDGCITLKSRDGAAFRILSMQPPLITEVPATAAAEHSIRIDWAKYREMGVSRKTVLYFDHPRCQSLMVNVQFSRAELEAIRSGIVCPLPTRSESAPVAADPLGDVQTLITQGHNERILVRIVEGALDVNARNAQGLTLLAIAARAGNVDLMQTLLNAGADIEARDNSGRTPLMHAATSKCAQAVRLLLDREARVAVRDSIGGTALTWASGFGDAASVQALLDAGAELEIVGHVTGWTPMIWAAGFNDAATVQILIRHGANLEAEDYLEGATPLIHAARTGKVESMWTLMRAGANLEHADFNGLTPLLAVARSPGGDAAKVRLLIDAGAIIHARDAAGRSALELAQRRTDPRAAEVVAVLQPR